MSLVNHPIIVSLLTIRFLPLNLLYGFADTLSGSYGVALCAKRAPSIDNAIAFEQGEMFVEFVAEEFVFVGVGVEEGERSRRFGLGRLGRSWRVVLNADLIAVNDRISGIV